MRADLFQVVTFATHPFRGNPAFVLSRTGAASDQVLAGMCDLLRAEVIAVIDDPDKDEPGLRFFTPEGPHPGAGHATLAAACIALRGGRRDLTFRLPSGEPRRARAAGGRVSVGFPRMQAEEVDRVADMEKALGARPTATWVAPFGYVGIFDNAAIIAGMRPEMERVAQFDRPAVIATAPGGDQSDIVIRVFAPNVGLPEDPVCGTAHRIIVPYWSERLGKAEIHSRHLSPRGGDLWCRPDGDEVIVAGESCLVIEGTAELPAQ